MILSFAWRSVNQWSILSLACAFCEPVRLRSCVAFCDSNQQLSWHVDRHHSTWLLGRTVYSSDSWISDRYFRGENGSGGKQLSMHMHAAPCDDPYMSTWFIHRLHKTLLRVSSCQTLPAQQQVKVNLFSVLIIYSCTSMFRKWAWKPRKTHKTWKKEIRLF